MNHSELLAFSPLTLVQVQRILPTFAFPYCSSLLTKNHIGIAQKVKSHWGR